MRQHIDKKGGLYFMGIAIAIAILWVLVSVFAYRVWIQGTDHTDFYPRWAGTRLMLLEEADLYSVDTTQKIQIMLYGAPIPAERDQQGFAYPAQLALFLVPFALIPDVEISAAIWTGFSFVLGLVSLMWVRCTHRPNAPIILPFFLLLWSYAVLMFFQAQFSTLTLAALAIGLSTWKLRFDLISGVVLALAFVKPELAVIPAIAFLIAAIKERRLKVLIGFLAASSILGILTFISFGWWLPRWIEAVGSYANYAKVFFAPGELWVFSPILFAIFYVCAGILIFLGRTDHTRLIALAIPAGLLLIPQTLMWGLMILTLSLLLAWEGRVRYGVVIVWALGWIFLLINLNPDWWKIQMMIISFLTLILLVLPRGDSQKSEAV